MANPPPSDYPNFGALGENLVAQWLQSSGWLILHRRFRSRWGEIDLIAQSTEINTTTQESILAFVEVKTRSPGNWDAGGRDAVTAKKQAKIALTARMFLAQHPHKADYPCRFDVAIVLCEKVFQPHIQVLAIQPALASCSVAGYQLQLQEYISGAFDFTID